MTNTKTVSAARGRVLRAVDRLECDYGVSATHETYTVTVETEEASVTVTRHRAVVTAQTPEEIAGLERVATEEELGIHVLRESPPTHELRVSH